MRCNRSINGRTKVMVIIAAGAVAIASCGGGSPRTVLVPAPQQQPTPGHDSPQAAAAGYMTGYLKADAKMICEYVAPPQAGVCSFLVKGSTFSMSQWSVGNSMVRGKEAIVVILADKFCAKFCIFNHDPNKGLPPKTEGFEAAFAATSDSLPALGVVKVGGRWYVALE